jgi:hypothetical protein
MSSGTASISGHVLSRAAPYISRKSRDARRKSDLPFVCLLPGLPHCVVKEYTATADEILMNEDLFGTWIFPNEDTNSGRVHIPHQLA